MSAGGGDGRDNSSTVKDAMVLGVFRLKSDRASCLNSVPHGTACIPETSPPISTANPITFPCVQWFLSSTNRSANGRDKRVPPVSYPS